MDGIQVFPCFRRCHAEDLLFFEHQRRPGLGQVVRAYGYGNIGKELVGDSDLKQALNSILWEKTCS